MLSFFKYSPFCSCFFRWLVAFYERLCPLHSYNTCQKSNFGCIVMHLRWVGIQYCSTAIFGFWCNLFYNCSKMIIFKQVSVSIKTLFQCFIYLYCIFRFTTNERINVGTCEESNRRESKIWVGKKWRKFTTRGKYFVSCSVA